MTIVHWKYLPLMKPRGMSHDEISEILSRAANEWNKAMQNLVCFEHGMGDLQVRLFFGSSINRIAHPNRIAECRDKKGAWEIEFDIGTKWNNGKWWKKMLGIGENFIPVAIHEFGHVLDLPHSMDYTHIMHQTICDVNSLSINEAQKYRQFFLEREKFNN
jgi:hypothetical protein